MPHHIRTQRNGSAVGEFQMLHVSASLEMITRTQLPKHSMLPQDTFRFLQQHNSHHPAAEQMLAIVPSCFGTATQLY